LQALAPQKVAQAENNDKSGGGVDTDDKDEIDKDD